MKRILITAVSAALWAAPASAIDATAYIGEIKTFAFDYCPRGFAPVDGRLLKVSDHTLLYSVIGTSFGGNAIKFALPLGNPVFTVDGKPLIQCIALTGRYPQK